MTGSRGVVEKGAEGLRKTSNNSAPTTDRSRELKADRVTNVDDDDDVGDDDDGNDDDNDFDDE